MKDTIKEDQEQADLNLYSLLCGKPKANKINKEIMEILQQ